MDGDKLHCHKLTANRRRGPLQEASVVTALLSVPIRSQIRCARHRDSLFTSLRIRKSTTLLAVSRWSKVASKSRTNIRTRQLRLSATQKWRMFGTVGLKWVLLRLGYTIWALFVNASHYLVADFPYARKTPSHCMFSASTTIVRAIEQDFKTHLMNIMVIVTGMEPALDHLTRSSLGIS